MVRLHAVEFEYFARSAKAAALFFSNIQFEKENSYFDIGSQLKPLLHTWSLAVEEQFYIVFPITMALLAKAGRKPMVAVLVTILIASFVSSTWIVQRSPAAGFYLSQYRVWELLLGAMLAFNLIAQPARTSVSRWCASLGVGLIVYSVFFFSEATTFPGPAALLPCFGAALVIYGRASNGISYTLLTSRPFVFIGLISYSLYLWHWPLIVFTRYFTGHALSLSQNVLLVLLSTVVSTISWRFIERPFRGHYSKVSGMTMFSAGAAAIIVAVLLAGFVKAENGFPERLSGPALKAYSAMYDLSRFNSPECFTEDQGVGPSVNDVRSGKLCQLELAGPGPIDFIVWGDSHSAAMAPAIDEAAAKFGMRGLLAGHASCPPLPGVILSVKNDVDTEHCGDYNAAVRSLITAKRISVVIMAAYWPKYIHDAELPNEGLYFDPSLPPPLQDHSAPISAAMDETLKDLGDQGIRTVLVMDVPEMGHFMPEALAKAVATGASTDIAPPWNYIAARQALSRSIIQKLASAHGSVVVDPLSAICPGNHCDSERDGVALYKDADHITATTARSLAYLYTPLFQSISKKAE